MNPLGHLNPDLLRNPNPPVVELTIRLLRSGQIQVMFPLNMRQVLLQMMSEAAKVINDNERGDGAQIIAPEQKAIIEV